MPVDRTKTVGTYANHHRGRLVGCYGPRWCCDLDGRKANSTHISRVGLWADHCKARALCWDLVSNGRAGVTASRKKRENTALPTSSLPRFELESPESFFRNLTVFAAFAVEIGPFCDGLLCRQR